jgi:hypothetical protein
LSETFVDSDAAINTFRVFVTFNIMKVMRLATCSGGWAANRGEAGPAFDAALRGLIAPAGQVYINMM